MNMDVYRSGSSAVISLICKSKESTNIGKPTGQHHLGAQYVDDGPRPMANGHTCSAAECIETYFVQSIQC